MKKVFVEVYYCDTHECCSQYHCWPSEVPECGNVIDLGFGKKGKVMETAKSDIGYMVFVKEW